jgi:hypothetical protein
MFSMHKLNYLILMDNSLCLRQQGGITMLRSLTLALLIFVCGAWMSAANLDRTRPYLIRILGDGGHFLAPYPIITY